MSKVPRPPCASCWIEQTPRDSRLRLRWRHGGTKCSYGTNLEDTPATRAQLEALRQVVAGLLARGTDPRPLLDQHRAARAARPAAAAPTVCTLRAYYAQWIADQVPPRVRRAQARDYGQHFTGYILPILGDVPLADLKQSDVVGLETELLTTGRPRQSGAPRPRRGTPSQHLPLSAKTVKNIIGASLRAMLRQARADEVLGRDVFAGYEWPKGQTPKADPFTPEERGRLLAWFLAKTFRVHAGPGTSQTVARRHPAYHAFVHSLFWTGVRPSEASGLQWGDVDLERARAQVQRSRHLGAYAAPKTGRAERSVELFPEVVRLLRALQPLHVTPETPVFTHTRGGPIEPNSFLPHWYAAQRACGIRVRGLYSTKDTFVTTALTAGVKIAWLEEQTGVAYATLKRHYGNWMPLDEAGELQRFAALEPSLFARPQAPVPPAGRGPKGQGPQPPGETRLSRCERGDLNPHGVATTGS